MKGLSVLVLSVVVMCAVPSFSQAEMNSMMKNDSVMNKGDMMGMDSMKEDVAVGGFCATCLIHGMKNKGSSEYKTIYNGKTYMFTSKETKMAFDENPAENAKEAQMKYDAMMKK